MYCAATPARRSRSPTTPAATGIARSARRCRPALAGSAAGRSAAGRVLPCGVHAAGADQRDRLLQQDGDLRPAVRGRRRDAAHHRRRPEASRRADRRDAGPAHLGLGTDAPSACARHRSRRWPIPRRRTLGRLSPGLLPAGAGALAAVPPSLPRGTRPRAYHSRPAAVLRRVRRARPTHGPSPTGSRRCAKCEWVVYAKRPFAGPAAVLAYLSRYTHRVAISNRGCSRSTNAASPFAGRTTAPRARRATRP